jgi:type IV pilus assembly protein PilO
MSLLDDLRSLDTNDPGRWPLPFRVAGVVLVFAAVVGAGVWYFVIKADVPTLKNAQAEELTLRASFESKQRLAANFDAYKAQLEEIDERFGSMLRQLPSATEIPNLIDDIGQTGLAAGLDPKQFTPAAEVQRDFYVEVPIKLRYTGSYHALAEFVSDIAALSRIVTIHDVKISPVSRDTFDELTMEATAKTYKYVDEDTPTP